MTRETSRREMLAAGLAGTVLAGQGHAQATSGSPRRQPAADPAEDAGRLAFARSLLGKGRKVVRRTATVRGVTFAYDTVLGAIQLLDDAARPSAVFVYFAYFRRDGKADRPVTFAWGGGPSGPSSRIHPVLGPRGWEQNGEPHFVDNPDTMLDRSDLVMVDPVGTGWSMPEAGRDYDEFYSVAKDGASVAKFIRHFLADVGRPRAPVYLTGGSYGTIRIPAVLHFLKDFGTDVAGIFPSSAAMDGNAFWEASGNMAAFYLMVPNYAAIAWYHKRQANPAATVEEAIGEGAKFALGDYIVALMAWPNVPPDQKKSVLDRLHALTGIKQEVWERYRLRMKGGDFSREFMRDQGMVLPANDARLPRSASAPPPGLPGADGRESPVDVYVRQELGLQGAPRYRAIAPGLVEEGAKARSWPTDHRGVYPLGSFLVSALPNYLDDVAEAMKANPKLRVQQHSGYYDLQCTSFPSQWSLANINIPDELRGNIQHFNYASGHIIYDVPSERAKWVKNVAAFYET